MYTSKNEVMLCRVQQKHYRNFLLVHSLMTKLMVQWTLSEQHDFYAPRAWDFDW